MKKLKGILCILVIITILCCSISTFAIGKVEDFDYAFMYGTTDSSFSPTNNVTREEASAVFYRILKQSDLLGTFTTKESSSFKDISNTHWSKNALEYLKYTNVLDKNFIKDEKVSPRQPLTRAEVAYIMVNTMEIQPTSPIHRIPDIKNHKFEYEIAVLYQNAIATGKDDEGNFYPNDLVSRAEFTKMVNIMLGRTIASYNISNIITPFKDISRSDWFYNDVLLGSNAFSDGFVDYNKKIERNILDMQ
ncbi:MAG: S-layer homology domain-containing protein [Oscillospiraceae bacterium]